MSNTHGVGGWRRLLRRLLPERGTTPTPPAAARYEDSPARQRAEAWRTRATGASPGGSTHLHQRSSSSASRPTVSRSTYDPLLDPVSPQHQAVYGGPYWGAGRADPSASSTSDCTDRTPSRDSNSSHGGGYSSNDNGGGSSGYGGGSAASGDSGSHSSGDSGGSW